MAKVSNIFDKRFLNEMRLLEPEYEAEINSNYVAYFYFEEDEDTFDCIIEQLKAQYLRLA